MNNTPYPMKFFPIYKDYPWGGSRIPETYQRDVPPGTYAESWEIADHADGMSVVANGPLTGQTLHDILKANPAGIMGTHVDGPTFPLLIKLIDAKQKLSVQVHPNDATSIEFGGEAKTEMWYLLGDNPTQVYCGLKDDVTKASFQQAVVDGTSGKTMQSIPVENGSVVFVRGGGVHAIDAGCLILEIQQNSNTTYRIHDWGRMGNDGKPRELHVEQAVNVINWDDREDPLIEPILKADTEILQLWELLRCEYFCLDKLVLAGRDETLMTGETFHILFVAEGETRLDWQGGNEILKAGESILIPAALPAYTLEGKATILRTFIP